MSGGDGRFHLGHRPGLDGVRGIAILAVLAHHLWVPWAKGGFAGVDLFFALSGFLITSLLQEEWSGAGRVRLRDFYLRRGFRLLPALLALLAGLAAYALFLAPHGRGAGLLKAGVIALFYSTNWFMAYQAIPHGPLAHTWSLSIEEQFYIVWPGVFVLLMARRVPRPWILAFLGVALAASASFHIGHWFTHQDHLRVYYGSDTRADGLLAGCLAGLLVSWDLLPRSAAFHRALNGTACAGLVAWIAVVILGLPRDTLHGGGFLGLDLAGVLLILALVRSPSVVLRRAFEMPALVWIGRISYGLYLWHFPLYFIADWGPYPSTSWAGAVIRLAATFAVAALSFHLLERPLLAYSRRRFAAPGR